MPKSNEGVLNLGIIGCSKMVYDFIYDCTKNYPFKLQAVCGNKQDVDLFTGRYVCESKYEDYKKMLSEEKLDLVISFSNENSQFEVARDCLNAGAHVFSERPVCKSSEEASEIIRIQRKTNRYVMARLNRRFVPTYVMAKEITRRDEFGTPKMYLAKYHAPAYESEKVFIWNHVIHHLDLARFLLGELEIQHVDRIYVDPKRVGYNISFKTNAGCIGVIQTSSLQAGEYPMERVDVIGDGRNVIIDNIRSLQYNRPSPARLSLDAMKFEDNGDTLILNQNFAQLNNFTFYGFENCFEYLADKILSGEKPEPNMEDIIKTIKLVETLDKMVMAQKGSSY